MVDAVGAATVTAPIELTVDVDALRAAGITSQALLALAIDEALIEFGAYIQGAGRFNLPG